METRSPVLGMTEEDRGLLKFQDSAFRKGNKVALRTARAKLSRRPSEQQSMQMARELRQDMQHLLVIVMTAYQNNFYKRPCTQNTLMVRKTTPFFWHQVLCLTMADVKKALRRVNPQKSAWTDNIPGECSMYVSSTSP